METIDFYTMKEYCEEIKKYFEIYNKNELYVQSYGDSKEELTIIINNQEYDETMFFISLDALIGAKTRVLKANHDIPFLNWMGGGEEEVFTKKHFIETMKLVWTNL